ncbi:MAG: class I SAM-dependent methyltransferase [Desulfobacteraceae bacterium]|nr:MAG: class I SAM-dependent methyltransferase [Desulfobacteraceae bacterium]
MSWVEHTTQEVDFIVRELHLQGHERILDLACGFGRHALELSRRGYAVVGVDITPEFIEQARKQAEAEQLTAEFICADLREIAFDPEFDVVLNLADGAIGYLENDRENLKIFDLISSALKPGGKHLLGVCNAAYARKHFPRRHWEMGRQSISLADFVWDADTSRMVYTDYILKFGEALTLPLETVSSIRLYTPDELHEILFTRGMKIHQTYGDYNASVPASDDRLTLLVRSQKIKIDK